MRNIVVLLSCMSGGLNIYILLKNYACVKLGKKCKLFCLFSISKWDVRGSTLHGHVGMMDLFPSAFKSDTKCMFRHFVANVLLRCIVWMT